MSREAKPVSAPLTFREIRYREKERSILKKAAQLFAKKGYEKATIEEIAAGLKLNKASLYHYVKSKEELLFRIQMEALDQANEVLEQALDMDLDPEEKFRKVFKSHVVLATKENIIGNLRQQEFILPPKWQQIVITARNRFEKNFMNLIEEGVEAGCFEKKNWKMAALSILGTLVWIPRWYSHKGELSPEQIADALADFFIRGLTAKQSDLPG